MSENNQAPQQQAVHYVSGQYPAVRDDEIDLKELILGLWAEKWLIVAITSVFTLGALIYALTATPYFKTEAKIRPVPEQYLANINNTKLLKLESSEVFVKVYGMLESRTAQESYMLANKDLFSAYFDGKTDREAFAAFLKDGFQLGLPDEKKDAGKGYFISVTYVAPQGIDGAAVLDGYFAFVADKVKAKILEQVDLAKSVVLADLNFNLRTKADALEQSVEVEVAKLIETDTVQKQNLIDQKAAILKELSQRRSNRVAELAEALAIAEKLDIQDPKTISSFGAQSKLNSAQGASVITEVNNGNQPLYLMGVNALSAEIEVLKTRTNDAIADSRIAVLDRQLAELENNRRVEALEKRIGNESFYTAIDELKTEIARLNTIAVSNDSFQVLEVSDRAYTNEKKVKPKRAIILVLGIIFGMFIGFAFTLARRIFK